MRNTDHIVYSEGFSLSSSQSVRFETTLLREPENYEIRLSLLGYYNNNESAASSEKWLQHMKWMIEHRPNEAILASIGPPRVFTPTQQAALGQVWLSTTERYQTEWVILHAAAYYFKCIGDFKKSEQLFKRAIMLNPSAAELLSGRAALLIAWGTAEGKGNRPFVEFVFRECDTALEMLSDERGQIEVLLIDLATLAIDIGELDRAIRYAKALLQIGLDLPQDNRRYMGHTFLGLIAVRQGLISQSQEHLRECATIGFVPDFSLAAELMDQGLSDDVLVFLRMVQSTAEGSSVKIQRLIDEIEASGRADLTTNDWD